MNYRKILTSSLTLWIICLSVHAQMVNISLFNETPLKSVVVSTLKGKYKVTADHTKEIEFTNTDAIYISIYGERIVVRNSQQLIGTFSSLIFEGVGTDNVLRINPVSPSANTRQYNDNLRISVAFGRLSLINQIQPDNYIAGVVEAEAGGNADMEFYKAQSVLARTYLYGHFSRHESEGFQLCDGVHCQAYNGRSIRNPAIIAATKATAGMVLISTDSTFITAVFHADCGGETESAEHAWLSGKSYLVSVKDPFCQNSPSSKWEKTIPLDQWKIYLKDHGFKLKKDISPGSFDFSQITRRQYYVLKKDSIPTKQIRTDFQLRSAFFSVIASDNSITFKGKGFGHGVGMCQDGAIQMARAGYKYEDILKFYFKDIRLINLNGEGFRFSQKN